VAVFTGCIDSKVLQRDVNIVAILPRPTGKPLKTLYLLHGFTDNASIWLRRTNIEEYAERHNIAIICPEVPNSYYADMAHGPKYATYIGKELPAICEGLFNLSAQREDRYIAGLSMGGYGAASIGLRHHEQYAAAGVFSAVCEPDALFRREEDERFWQDIFGDDLVLKDEQNLYRLAEAAAKGKHAPRLMVTCGTKDELYGQFQRFCKHLAQLPLEVTVYEWEADHVWPFWDKCLQLFLDELL